jgi:putative transposase
MVSNSGFYYWLKYPVSKRLINQNELLVQIEEIHKDSKCRYGSPRIAAALKFRGVIASRTKSSQIDA